MTFVIERSLITDDEFLNLPLAVREAFIQAFETLQRTDQLDVSGPGWTVKELRQRRPVFREGLYSLHVGPIYRGLFIRLGPKLRFIAFGPHLPKDDVYRKLGRARQELARLERETRAGPTSRRPIK